MEITTATLHNILVKDSVLKFQSSREEEKKKRQDRHPEILMVDPMSFPNSKHSDVDARNGSLDSADQVSLLKSRKWDTRPCTSPIPESDLPFLDSEKRVSLKRA